MVLIVQIIIGYVASMSLFKAAIHKTKHSQQQSLGVSVEFMDVPPLDLI